MEAIESLLANNTEQHIINALVDMGIADGDEFEEYSVEEFLGSMDTQTFTELKGFLATA
jgi:hypothetical protein